MSQELVIANVSILQDEHGRYSLNTLHRASEKSTTKSKAPGQWVRLRSTSELVNALKNNDDAYLHLAPIEVVHGGDRAGIYAHELLAVEYAGWISPAFRLKVNQAFLDSKRGVSLTPQVHDPALQALLVQGEQLRGMILELDQTRHVAESALRMAQGLVNEQQMMTIAEFVYWHGYYKQLPQSLWAAFGKHVTGHCVMYNIPLRKINVPNKPWDYEFAYPSQVLNELFWPWVKQFSGQLRIEEASNVD